MVARLLHGTFAWLTTRVCVLQRPPHIPAPDDSVKSKAKRVPLQIRVKDRLSSQEMKLNCKKIKML